MQLGDLAGAGVAEFARQWILLSRRKPYDPGRPGEHRLIMNYGGSAGHCGVLAIDVREGELQPGGPPRTWEVTCSPLQEAQQADQGGVKAAGPGQGNAKLLAA